MAFEIVNYVGLYEIRRNLWKHKFEVSLFSTLGNILYEALFQIICTLLVHSQYNINSLHL